MTRPTPALDRARLFLEDRIRASRSEGEPQLPAQDQLARMAGVSLATMSRAVRLLARRGHLFVSQGRATFAAQVGPSSPSACHGAGEIHLRQKWQRLAARISDEIARGGYAPGTFLPQTKELRERYAVCHQTLAKALRRLCSEELLEQVKKRYRVPSLSGQSPSNSVVLVAGGNPSGSLIVYSPRMEEHLRTLQRECAKAKLRLKIICYSHADGLLHDASGAEVTLGADVQRGSTLGFIVWTIGLGSPLQRLVALIQLQGKPVALFDETGQEDFCAMARGRMTRMYSIAGNAAAGFRMGRFLQGLGHCRVGYISPVHGGWWSRERLRGMVRAYRQAGRADGVHEFTRHEPSSQRHSTPGLAQAAMSAVAQAHGQPRLAVSPLFERHLTSAVYDESLRAALDPLLEAAIADSGITAWVAASDTTAVLCLDFLRSKGLSVPRDISVVGFDDGFDAFLYHLTSYNFNGSAAMHAMLAHVVRPLRGRRPDRPVEIEGFVTERGTTAPPTP